MSEVRSTCCYCGTGCGVIVRTEGERIVGVEGDPDHPSSRGRLCSKGSTLHLTMAPGALAGRARHPELRTRRDEPRRRVSWDRALDHVADRFAQTLHRHGPDAVAFYVSGQLLTEDYYVFNKLAKGLVGTANIDTNSRLCMSSAVTGYQKTLGADAPPGCYDDIDHARCLFIAGSNTAFAHPVLFRRIEDARVKRPDLKVIVVDPRRTETARFADLHLAILPGTDVALFHAMLHVMLWEKWVDEAWIAAHTEGFEALRAIVREVTPAAAAEICGVRADDIMTAARWFAGSSPSPLGEGRGEGHRSGTLSLYCQGLNQSARGTSKNAALINLHLATGQIGRPGTGPLSLTGQPNAMGGREVGAMATSLAAHRALEDRSQREEIQRLWGVENLPSSPGLTAVELFEALKHGRVKAVWIACTNPAQSMPDLTSVRAALQAAELVVLQEAYANTETAEFADVLLPATSWGEKEGTVTNSERRISRVRAALPKPSEARHDWEIICDFARRLSSRRRPGAHDWAPACAGATNGACAGATNGAYAGATNGACAGATNGAYAGATPNFHFPSPEAIWNEHRETTRGLDLDITGLSYEILERAGPQQWPYPEGAREGRARLYGDGAFPTPGGKARFLAERYEPVAEPVDARYPLRLTTGRLRDQWHGMSRTGTVASLFGHAPEPRLAMSPNDMARRGIADGDLVRVQSRRGAIHVIAEADDAVRSGQVCLPMHWGKRFLGGRESAGANTVTLAAFDPFSRQPELKHAAVKVSAVELAWRLVAFAECDPENLVATFDALGPLQAGVAFASVVLIGRDRPGVLLRAANEAAPDAGWLARLDTLLGLDAEEVLRYEDARRNHSRRIRIGDEQLKAVRLTGDPGAITSGEWLRQWLVSARPVAEVRRLLLSPATHAPSGFVLSGRVVCQCYNVGESDIRAALGAQAGSATERLEAVRRELKCGTHCGSCLPELRALVAGVAMPSSRLVA